MSDQIIARVSQSLAKEQSLESLVRQLLEMLEMVTDMESTYLTKVDVEARLQHIMFARNSQKMHIPENFTVSWDYSLCKRAIDENCFFSDEVPDRWGDCIAARNLGITTFLSTPIHLPDGSFYGTLCAA
ncbi:diguanylate cyclase DgcP, partial [Escherichia coli]|nr:diguanylate cyclase DgcP [Escherichia coli]